MKTKKALLALISAVVGLLLAATLLQIYLMVSGWRPVSGDGYLQFGYRTGIPVYDEDGLLKEGQPVRVRLFEPDPDLFWKPIPGTGYTNAAGFRGGRTSPGRSRPGRSGSATWGTRAPSSAIRSTPIW